MRISRFFLNQPIEFLGDATDLEILDGDRVHYIRTVLRLKVLDKVTIFNGQGGEYSGAIAYIDKKRVTITLNAFISEDRSVSSNITIGISIIKRESMDIAMQKITELGATHICPIISNRVSVSMKQIHSRQDHWQNVVISACQQSGLNLIPEISKPIEFEDWCSSQQGARYIADIDGPAFQLAPMCKPENLTCLVGPEGGFTQLERAHATQNGFLPVNLGARILRAETAAVALMTLANQRLLTKT